jgi:hypothetical protein
VVTYEGPRLLLGEEAESEAIKKAKVTDTDDDGITDYDEQNIYKTSAYLADSDSDGLSDSIEIMGGQDPNCARGGSCESILENKDAVRTEGVGGTFVGGAEQPLVPDGVPTEADVTALESLSAEDVRALLLESGVSQAELSKLTDEQIMTLYQQVLKEVSEEQVAN